MNRRSILITSLVLISALLLLAPTTVADTGEETSNAVLKGRTLDAFNQPLPGVLVILENGDNTTSTESGYFLLHTTSGEHTVQFYKQNYTTETMFVDITGSQLDMGDIQFRGDINPDQNLVFILFVGCTLFILMVIAVVFWRKD